MKNEIDNIIDELAKHGTTTRLIIHLYAKSLIPETVYVTLLQSSHCPYERAGKLFLSVKATLEAVPDFSREFYSCIKILKIVGLTTIADRIIKNASKAMHNNIILLMLYIGRIECSQAPQMQPTSLCKFGLTNFMSR